MGDNSPLEVGQILFDVPALDAGAAQPPVPRGAPAELQIRWEAPMPVISSRAHLDVRPGKNEPSRDPAPRHPLVTIGDSLTQGFKSFAISETWLSWPVIVAHELGLRSNYGPNGNVADPEFTYPTFTGPAVAPGLPLNLESLLWKLDDAVGGRSFRWKELDAAVALSDTLRTVAEYWERGDGSKPPPWQPSYFTNLAVWGFDVRDALEKSPEWCEGAMHPNFTSDHPLRQVVDRIRADVKSEFKVSFAQERTALRTLRGPDPQATQVSAAKALGDDGGIETLIVALGSNNALGVVMDLSLRWSEDDGYRDLRTKDAYNIWAPRHFQTEYDALVRRIREIDARHVILATVPHVTIAPLARGVGDKPYYSRYFARYTKPWITDAEFDASLNPCLTGDEARAVDAAIDQYNYTIKRHVRDARNSGRDWYLLDLCGLLDRLAYRRYLSSPDSQPGWFIPYDLPVALKGLSPRPDTRFFGSDWKGRTQGGIIALDGVHPTTIGYGIVAQEVINVMGMSGVHFGGRARTGQSGVIEVDFDRLIANDSLISHTPPLLNEAANGIAALNKLIDLGNLMMNKPPA